MLDRWPIIFLFSIPFSEDSYLVELEALLEIFESWNLCENYFFSKQLEASL